MWKIINGLKFRLTIIQLSYFQIIIIQKSLTSTYTINNYDSNTNKNKNKQFINSSHEKNGNKLILFGQFGSTGCLIQSG